MNPLLKVRAFGQQIWLDNLSRTLLRDGHLTRMIAEDGVSGVTTNPSIFHKAIADGRYYEQDLHVLRSHVRDAEARYEQLVIPDVRAACDALLPVFDASHGQAGYVSLEVSPELAHDAEGTVAAGRRLAGEVARPNLLVKVPATAAGLEAIEALIGAGINVNVTLMFSLAHVEAVAQAYVRGLRRLQSSGGDVSRAMSVASVFLSRVDTLVDARLASLGDEARQLQGRTAVSLARLAYRRYADRFHGEAFADLRTAGARPQYMLWASTGTKNPDYSDLLYVESVVGVDTINTLPDATLVALRDHGMPRADTISDGVDQAQRHFEALAGFGIDLEAVGEQLQREGLAQFETAFSALMQLME
ncbi:MAG: transaldolase [Rhodocyclaceae bacterium]